MVFGLFRGKKPKGVKKVSQPVPVDEKVVKGRLMQKPLPDHKPIKKKIKNFEIMPLRVGRFDMLLSDHGEPLGEHGIVRKVRPWPYEELSRIVLMVKLPGGERGGTRVRAFAQTPDLLPTILDALEVPGERSRWAVTPEPQGRSLLPVMLGEEERVRDCAIAGHYGRSWSVRDEEYSLYLWPPPKAEYTFGVGPMPRRERARVELYRIDRNYVPPRPDQWSLGSQPEVENLVAELRDVAEGLELKLRRRLMEAAGW